MEITKYPIRKYDATIDGKTVQYDFCVEVTRSRTEADAIALYPHMDYIGKGTVNAAGVKGQYYFFILKQMPK